MDDVVGKAKIIKRIVQVQNGNFGNCEPAGQGVSEMKIDFGPGYRIYFMGSGNRTYLLLCGGDKKSQKRDIAKAKRMAGGLA